ncbi:hypothetical protein [Pleionea sp. CnH1-48]|uniref:hypothetical protein n=1 Tax=Pleionea sp. CnH1-48 TaxID=2954494 RepID=UPI002096F41E|nr:hypothetical protein [Pleionea sp. CnH1-48]MCO7224305.1 hypothetical protein [Pleionea sp. CnH1-48]
MKFRSYVNAVFLLSSVMSFSVANAEFSIKALDTINLLHEKAAWNGRTVFSRHGDFETLKKKIVNIIERNEVLNIDDKEHIYRFEFISGEDVVLANLGEFYLQHSDVYYLISNDEFLAIKSILENRISKKTR